MLLFGDARDAATSDFRALANDVELALELIRGHARAACADENLLDIRLRGARHAADGVAVDRRIAPAEDREPFFADDALEDAFALAGAGAAPPGRNTMPTPYSPGAGSVKPSLARLAREKFVRDLNQQPGAVAGFRIAAAGAAVRQIDEDLNALFDNVVGLLALDVGHKADAAGIVLLVRVVESLRLREVRRQFDRWRIWVDSLLLSLR